MSEAYERFVASLEMNFEKWHDGIGYDLDALAELTDDERKSVARMMASREQTWRELEVLEALDLPSSHRAIDTAYRDGGSVDARLAAAETLHRQGRLPEPIDQVLAREILRLTDIGDGGCTRALLMAEDHPTDAVKQALLDASRKRTESAMHCAALLCHLTGAATEAFDWNLRPLFLRLGPDEPEADRAAALDELRALVRM